jgi:DNA polymerase III sliding clamp (beta) subunit (PCNA family)
MHFVISREALLKPLQLVSGVVERRQTLPVLSNVLLVLNNDELSLTGTDLEVELGWSHARRDCTYSRCGNGSRTQTSRHL